MNPSESPEAAPPKHFSRLGCWLIGVLGLVLLFIALPGIIRSRGGFRGTNSCVSNLKQIDGAVRQWARDHNKAATDTYSLTDPRLLAYLKGSVLPTCPGGGHYSPGANVSGSPKCSLAAAGHTL